VVVGKHLIDLDETAVEAARAELGTSTLKDTVNEALRRAGEQRASRVSAALDTLAGLPDDDRDDAWR
jgi:Arc/MetJ family transcription regulator